MQVVQLTCPHCRASLKVRSRAFVGRKIDCPDCGGGLQIVSDSGAGFRVEMIGDAGSVGEERNCATGSLPNEGAIVGNSLNARLSKGTRRLATPLGLAAR